ncbi:hypothetical protein BT63DRAFT_214737 [Microthyrium microscopicum]|uniref:Uncharacterized protein n=1 Tax=Microthyrium microscopicum TaxID=703497 RepID=A0A6A6UGD4_9PEZI|nr:hypothetical protein BT63DRAFT_214737 [Microthyrium microscopicum]
MRVKHSPTVRVDQGPLTLDSSSSSSSASSISSISPFPPLQNLSPGPMESLAQSFQSRRWLHSEQWKQHVIQHGPPSFMDADTFIPPCLWSLEPCSHHHSLSRHFLAKEMAFHQTASTTSSNKRVSILSMPPELLDMIYMHLKKPTHRVTFALSCSGLWARYKTEALAQFPTNQYEKRKLLHRLESDNFQTIRFCEKCELLHTVSGIGLQGQASAARLQFGLSSFQIPPKYIQLATENFKNKGRGGICPGLLQCNTIFMGANGYQVRDTDCCEWPTTSYQYIFKQSSPTGNQPDNFASTDLNDALDRLYGPSNSSMLPTRFDRRAVLVARKLNFEGKSITQTHRIQTIVQDNGILLSGMFIFNLGDNPGSSSLPDDGSDVWTLWEHQFLQQLSTHYSRRAPTNLSRSRTTSQLAYLPSHHHVS